MLRWSGDGSTASSRQPGDSTEGIGSLMPIIQRSAISPAAPSSFSRLNVGDTGNQEIAPPEPPFRRRIGALRSPHSSRRAHARMAHLIQEPVQEDSPKGLNRALTPSMLKAVKQIDKGEGKAAEALVAPKSSGTSHPSHLLALPFTLSRSSWLSRMLMTLMSTASGPCSGHPSASSPVTCHVI